MKFSWLKIIYLIIGLILISGIVWPLTQDEGVFLYVGKLLAEGGLPYLSVFDHKTPGIYFIVASFYKIHLGSFLYLRLAIILVNLAIAYFMYLITRLLWSKGEAIYPAVFYLYMQIFFQGNLVLAEQFVALCLMACLYFIMRRKNKRQLIAAGVLACLAIIFKQTAILSVGIIWLWLIFGMAKTLDRRVVLLFITGFFAAAGLFMAWLVKNNLTQDFWQQAFVLNKNYQMYFSNELMVKLFMSFLTVAPIFILAGLEIYRSRANFCYWEKLAVILIIGNLATLVLRPYQHYWLIILPFVSLCAGKYYVGMAETNWRKWVNIYLVTGGLVFIIFSWQQKLLILKRQMEVTKYVKAATNEEEKIYASRFFTWIYSGADRQAASKYLYVNEVNKGLGAEQEILRNIREAKPKYVLWQKKESRLYDPQVKEITKFLEENYKVVKCEEVLNLQVLEIDH